MCSTTLVLCVLTLEETRGRKFPKTNGESDELFGTSVVQRDFTTQDLLQSIWTQETFHRVIKELSNDTQQDLIQLITSRDNQN